MSCPTTATPKMKYPSGTPRIPAERPANVPPARFMGDEVQTEADPPKQAEKPAKKPGQKWRESTLERDFAALVSGLPPAEREALVVPGRKIRADFYWPKAGLVVEAQGGIFGGKSGHNTGVALEKDAEKCRLYSLHGIRMYPVTRKSLDAESGTILEQITAILAPWYPDMKAEETF